MIISCIVAMNKERIIGLLNQIPWHLSADLRYFKKTTMGHHVLMGRKCYESIGRPLPGRPNIIISTNPEFVVSGCFTCKSVEEGIALAQKNGEEELFVIGGGEIYKRTIVYWDQIYLTEVDYNGPGDVYFPEINWDHYKVVCREDFPEDSNNSLKYSFIKYQRKK